MVVSWLITARLLFFQVNDFKIGKQFPEMLLIRKMNSPRTDKLANLYIGFSIFIINTLPFKEVTMRLGKPVHPNITATSL